MKGLQDKGEKKRRRRDGGGKRMNDGRGRKESHAPTQVRSLLSAGWIACHQPPEQLMRVKAKGGEGAAAAGGEGVIEKDRDVFSPPLKLQGKATGVESLCKQVQRHISVTHPHTHPYTTACS